MQAEVIIRAEGLTKSFGHRRALQGVDLVARRGERWTIFGPNGAGKTTLIGILSMLLRPSGGKLRIAGMGEGRDDKELRRRIGVVSHQTFLYPDLTTHENLVFYGRLYGVENLKERASRMLEEVGLGERAGELVRNLSRGMQQRLAIARALFHSPPILLLDEPHTGLDQHAIRKLHGLLLSLHPEAGIIIMTSHHLSLGLEASTHVAILTEGRLAFSAETKDLRGKDFEKLYFQCVDRGEVR